MSETSSFPVFLCTVQYIRRMLHLCTDRATDFDAKNRNIICHHFSKDRFEAVVHTVSMALCVASRCLHEYYSVMMEDQQEEEDVATWFVFYSDKENREYYYQPQSNTASWVLPKGARIYPHDDNTLDETDSNEASSPRESGPGFSDYPDDNVIEEEKTPGRSSKSFLVRFVALVTGHRFGMALLLLNVFLSSSWLGSVLLSSHSVLNVGISETMTAVAAEQVVVFKMPMETEQQVKEAAQKAASKGEEILQRIEGTVESNGYPIATRWSKNQLIEIVTEVQVHHGQPCRRPLSRLFSKECRRKHQKHREQQQASTDGSAPWHHRLVKRNKPRSTEGAKEEPFCY
jgi:hypothetical protein